MTTVPLLPPNVLAGPAAYPIEGLGCEVDESQIASAKEWLSTQGHMPSLIFFLRVPEFTYEQFLKRRAAGGEANETIIPSAHAQFGRVRAALARLEPAEIPWPGFVRFPHFHACAVRRPRETLLKLLDSDFVAHVARILVDAPLTTPEYTDSHPDCLSERQRLVDHFAKIGAGPYDFLNSLQIGDFSGLWAQYTGAGQRVCIIDSGADESHPALQRKIASHVLFDPMGHEKEAKYAIDRGCHGTKIAGVIAGNPLRGSHLGLPGDGEVHIGIARGATASVVNTMWGGCRRERGSVKHLLAGLEWAIQHKSHADCGRYDVVTVAWEFANQAFVAEVNEIVDDIIRVVKANGLVPVFAAGNGGPDAEPLGSEGTYVGACDASGVPWEHNGKRVDMLAPGVDLVAIHPPVDELGNDHAWLHSGSSLATAVVSGAVLLLAEASGRSPADCLEALRLSAQSDPSRRISLDRAIGFL